MPKIIETVWGLEIPLDLEEESKAVESITKSEEERLNFSRKLFK